MLSGQFRLGNVKSAPYSPRDRERFKAEPPKSSERTDYARDRARIMYSSALRRLGAKTQVVGPSTDSFVRTRLTHSIEVSQVGRSLGLELGCDPDIVDAACQAHDLGHPPFGHNGERALNQVAADIGGFEGNAQTFRLLTRLEPKILGDDGRYLGLNLTRATLDAVCKYPWLKGQGADSDYSTRKYNCYDEDAEVFTWMRTFSPPHQRCLEAQIMDISDDIAYSVHDVEDAIQTGELDPASFGQSQVREQVFQACIDWYGAGQAELLPLAWERITSHPSWLNSFNGSYQDMAQLKDMTSQLIGRFCQAVASATLEAAGSAPLHRYDADLVIPPDTLAEIKVLKGMAASFVMQPREKDPIHLQQRTLVFELYDALCERPELLEEPYLTLWRRAENDNQRQRAIVDQIASLTDTTANQWHGRICGMFRSLQS